MFPTLHEVDGEEDDSDEYDAINAFSPGDLPSIQPSTSIFDVFKRNRGEPKSEFNSFNIPGLQSNDPKLNFVQELKSHEGPIWVAKFSTDGKYLATAGQDKMLLIWRIQGVVDTYNLEHMLGKDNSEGSRENNTDLLEPTPFRIFQGHESDIVDLSWSRNDFVVTASTDSYVILWHPKR